MRLFISYSRTDAETADRMVERLEAADHEVVIDRRNLPYGEEWQSELAELIHSSDSIVWLISAAAVASSWCKWELGEASRLRKRLLPVKIEDLHPSKLPEELGKLHLLPAQGAFDFDRDSPLLLDAIATDQEWLREHTRLSAVAREWKSRDQSKDLLLRGAAIERAEAWSSATPSTDVSPTHDTMEFILSSRIASNQSLRRQRAFAVVFSLIALSLMAAAIIGATNASRQSIISDGLRIEADARAIATAEQRAVLLTALADQENSATRKLLIALEGWVGAGGLFPGFEKVDAFQDARGNGQILIEDLPAMARGDAPDYPQLAAILAANIDSAAETARFGSWEQAKFWDYQADRLVLVQETGAMTIWSGLEDTNPLRVQLRTTNGGDVKDVVLSPDGELLAVASDKGDLLFINASTGDVIFDQVIGTFNLSPLSFSGDGRFLAFTVSDGRIGIADVSEVDVSAPLEDLTIHSVFPGHERGTSALQWNKSGLRIYSGGGDNTVAAWRLGLNIPAWRTELAHPVTKLARSADGTTLVAELRYGREGLAVIDALSGEVRFQTDPRDETAASGQAFALYSDGGRMVWGTRTGKVILTGPEGGEIWQTTCGTAPILRVRLLQEGARIAVSGDEGDLCIIDPNEFRDPILETNAQERGALDDLRELPEGKLLGLSFHGPGRVFEVPQPKQRATLVANCLDGYVANQVHLSITERFAVVTSTFGFCIVDLDTGTVTFETTDAELAETGAFFGPEGETLLTEVRGRPFVVTLADGTIREVTGIDDYISGDLGYSFEGTLAFANHRDRGSVVEIQGAVATALPLSPPPESIAYVSASADLVVITTTDETVQFYDRASGARLTVADGDFPLSGTSIAAFEYLSGELTLGAVTFGQLATYWTPIIGDDGTVDLTPTDMPEGSAGRWEGLIVFGRFAATVADLASGRAVATIPNTDNGNASVALRAATGELIEQRWDTEAKTNLVHAVDLPEAVAQMIPRYVWQDITRAVMNKSVVDDERSRFLRIERQVNLAKQAREALDICLSPRERKRLGFGPEPPCWCADVSYPPREEWIVALGDDPFQGPQRNCQESNF